MGFSEKYDISNYKSNSPFKNDDDRKSSSLSGISHEQIFMPLSPTPDSLRSHHEEENIRRTTVNIKSPVKINSPKSLIEGGHGGSGGDGRNTTLSVSNTTPINKARIPVSTQQINKQTNNGNSLSEPNFFQSLFEQDPLIDNYDLNLYSKNFATYNSYQTPRLIDYDDDYLILDRIKRNIAKRDLSYQNRRTPFLHENKELNVKIDITTDGAKIRELTKSRNSNFTNTNTNRNNSRIINIDYLNDDFTSTTHLQNHRKNSIVTLPNINVNTNNFKSNRLRKDLGVNNANELNYLSNTPITSYTDDNNKTLKSVDALKNPNIHDYLYSLSKKTHETGYVDAFKEAQRRKGKNKPIYTIDDYRKYELNFGKDPLDAETDTDKSDKQKKRSEYANYVRNRNAQLFNDYNPNAISIAKDTHRSLPPPNNRLAPIDQNQNKKFKAIPKNVNVQKLHHHQPKAVPHLINN